MKYLLPAQIILALAVAGSSAQADDAANAATTPPPRCFWTHQWTNWKPAGQDTLYIGVNWRDVYRVDLSAGSQQLVGPDPRLISIGHGGSETICNALDLELTVAEPGGIHEVLIAKSITPLTPQQVAALPPQYRP